MASLCRNDTREFTRINAKYIPTKVRPEPFCINTERKVRAQLFQ